GTAIMLHYIVPAQGREGKIIQSPWEERFRQVDGGKRARGQLQQRRQSRTDRSQQSLRLRKDPDSQREGDRRAREIRGCRRLRQAMRYSGLKSLMTPDDSKPFSFPTNPSLAKR